jgi:hypothetical protein
MVRWITLALVEQDLTKRNPIMEMIDRCRPTKTGTTPQAMLNFSHLK